MTFATSRYSCVLNTWLLFGFLERSTESLHSQSAGLTLVCRISDDGPPQARQSCEIPSFAGRPQDFGEMFDFFDQLGAILRHQPARRRGALSLRATKKFDIEETLNPSDSIGDDGFLNPMPLSEPLARSIFLRNCLRKQFRR